MMNCISLPKQYYPELTLGQWYFGARQVAAHIRDGELGPFSFIATWSVQYCGIFLDILKRRVGRLDFSHRAIGKAI